MKVSENIVMFELPGCNVFLITGKKNVLIDTGMPNCREQLMKQLKSELGNSNGLDEILLTHHDIDHIGNLCAVQEEYPVSAYISKEDLPYAAGVKHRPGIKRIIETILKPGISKNLRSFDEYGQDEIKKISMPGHTPGHTIFKYQEFIFTGDLFHAKDGHITSVKSFMNWDNKELGKSIGKLCEMQAKMLCPSHGKPVFYTDEIREELRELGEHYDRRK